MTGRTWTIRPRDGRTLHLTKVGNPMKTVCGMRFASVSDYMIYEPMKDKWCPLCRKCKTIEDRRLVG